MEACITPPSTHGYSYRIRALQLAFMFACLVPPLSVPSTAGVPYDRDAQTFTRLSRLSPIPSQISEDHESELQ